jgi:hypothetical protein
MSSLRLVAHRGSAHRGSLSAIDWLIDGALPAALPLTLCADIISSAITFPRGKLQIVTAITETPYHFWQIVVAWANPKIREMAMKNNLILATVILLATLWVALDAGITALTLFS